MLYSVNSPKKRNIKINAQKPAISRRVLLTGFRFSIIGSLG
jgi:hypothetical protein